MKTFLIDGENVFDYDVLVNDVVHSTVYYPYYRCADFYRYFLNFIVALVSNESISLLDSDLSDSELIKLNVENVNIANAVAVENINSIDDICRRIWSSTSDIELFTSGTTGQPKRIRHSVQTLTRAVRISDSHASDIWGFAYNPTHIAGVQVFFQAFLNQNSVVRLFNINRFDVLNLIEKFQISHLSATPTFYRLLMPNEKNYNVVKRISIGGEKSDEKLYNQLKIAFPNARLNNIYASTEAGTLFASHGSDFQIPVHLKGLVIEKDSELMVHSSLLGRFEGGNQEFYPTGDQIEWIDKEQTIFRITSRKNEMLNIGGYKVNPFEVENVLSQISEIRQVLVYCKPNSVLGNILCADIVLFENQFSTELVIRQYCNQHLQDYKVPRRIKFVESITLTRSGKLKRV